MDYQNALQLIFDKAPFQKKKIQSFLLDKGPRFYAEADVFVNDYEKYLNAQGLSFEFAIDSYLAMCKNMIACQVSFMRTGKYPRESQMHAFSEVYDSREVMFGYMVGLGFSQFLWSSHYAMYEHLKSEILKAKQTVDSYLEVGPGHGLFLKYAVQNLKDECELKVIDISETSIDMARSLLKMDRASESKQIEYLTQDFLDCDLEKKYDFIVMGEVLEHVDNPKNMLMKIGDLLSHSGKAFISTCVNCPMTDHVYHFHTIEEIRELLADAGLLISSEQVLPVEDLPIDEIMRRKITINYSSMVSRA